MEQLSNRPVPCRQCRRTASHREDCKVGAYLAAVAALTPAEAAAYDELPYSTIPDPDDAVHVVATVRPYIEVEVLRALAAELRASSATGGIEYVDAAWLESRAEQVERSAKAGNPDA